MSIDEAEVSSLYGALDSTTFADGEAMSAHVLRVLAMNGNRLATKGHPLFNLVWPTRAVHTDLILFTTTYVDGGGFAGIAWPQWIKCLHTLPVPKKPMLNKASIRVRARITDGETIYLQIASTVRPPNRSIAFDAENVLEMLGTGDMEDYDIDDVPISSGGFEAFEFFIGSNPTLTLGDTGTYGSPNTGSILHITSSFMQVDASGNTWNLSIGAADSWDEGGHFVEFVDASGLRLGAPRTITRVTTSAVSGAGPLLTFAPDLSPEEVAIVTGGEYNIIALPRFNIANIAAAAQQLEII